MKKKKRKNKKRKKQAKTPSSQSHRSRDKTQKNEYTEYVTIKEIWGRPDETIPRKNKENSENEIGTETNDNKRRITENELEQNANRTNIQIIKIYR